MLQSYLNENSNIAALKSKVRNSIKIAKYDSPFWQDHTITSKDMKDQQPTNQWCSLVHFYPDIKDHQINIDKMLIWQFVSDQCLIDVDPNVFAIWDSMPSIEIHCIQLIDYDGKT